MATTIIPPSPSGPGPPTGGGAPPPAPGAPAPPEPPRRRRLGPRVVLGALIVFALSGAATATYLFHEVTRLRHAIDQNPSLTVTPGALATAPIGAPQTILLVGDDRRVLTRYYHNAVASHSNEMLLIRFDPAKPWISMMSIPRELWVPIYPPNGPEVTNRINFAYTLGGTGLMVQTIKQVTGLTINHVLVIDFAHFARAVNEIGCVYSTIDHRYYHSNVGSVAQYQEIDLQPGYQRLCGPAALEFVSYRHDDTSLIRDARDQSFMLDVKKQYGSSLFAQRAAFERIFGQAVQTDPSLHTTQGLLQLLTLLVQSSGRPVRQVQFQATLGATYDTATAQQIRASVDSFLYGNPRLPTARSIAAARAVSHESFLAHLSLVPTPAYDLAAARLAAPDLPFPLEYPRVRNQLPSALDDDLRVYEIHDERNHLHKAYVIVISRGLIGQYYDVQGMDWNDPPIFNDPDQTVTVGHRTYFLYYDGSRLEMVAWHEDGASYWVRNTLTDDVGNDEMLAIAAQTQPVTAYVAPPRSDAGLATLVRRAQAGANRAARGAVLDPLVALLAWLGIAVLAVGLVVRRREIMRLRHDIASAVALEARSPVAAAGVGAVALEARSPVAAAGVGAGAPARAAPAPRRVTRRPSARRRRARALAVLALAAAAVVALRAALDSSASRPDATVSRPAVAVLNATSRAGAAHALAAELHAHGTVVTAIGNAPATGETTPYTVLYATGRRAQAGEIAGELGARATALAPLDPATSAAVGRRAPIVIVIN